MLHNRAMQGLPRSTARVTRWMPPLAAAWLLLVAGAGPQQTPKDPPRGPFGFSRVTTHDGQPADIASFASPDDCGVCHPRQLEEFDGSFHSVSHHDPFYRAFALMARREAGPEVYAYCSGCHTPAGVVSGLVPKVPEAELPEIAKAGVTCDVCHQISALTGTTGPWAEPGNASLVLQPDPKTKRGPLGDIQKNPNHGSVRLDVFGSSELCASCHTVIHPLNGLRIEHTYDEWRNSVYAAKGIQCQDCHMASVEDARQVAQTLQPVRREGRASAMSTKDRPARAHTFVGANANAERLTGSAEHAALARARLKSAAELEVSVHPSKGAVRGVDFEVVVRNVGAGHMLPTSLTELREMWLEVHVVSADGKVLYESGTLDEHGELREGAVRFGTKLGDAQGKPTYKPWEATQVLWKRLIPPKGQQAERIKADVPAGTQGPLTIEARLLYRSAAPHVLQQVMGDEAFVPEVVEMATAQAQVELR
jgi:hypothetical protein